LAIFFWWAASAFHAGRWVKGLMTDLVLMDLVLKF
jgi:hypothetical protein